MNSPKTPKIEDSFLFQHMVYSLKAEPDWTIGMYCAYNDISDEIRFELETAYKKYKKKK